jgi:hypothetical protein
MTVLATLYTMKECQFCDKFKPIWKSFAKYNKDHVNEVNCSDKPDICKKQGLYGVPCVRFTKSSEPKFKMDHVGDRTVEALQNTLDILKKSKCEKST